MVVFAIRIKIKEVEIGNLQPHSIFAFRARFTRQGRETKFKLLDFDFNSILLDYLTDKQ